MGKAIVDSEIGGVGVGHNIHFHEDGPFIGQALPTGTDALVSEVFDFGEALAGITIRAFADAAITGTATDASVTVKIFAGNNKDATAGSTDWTQVAQITASGTAIAAAGDELGAYTPTPGMGYKYYYATLEGGAGMAGTVSVYNEVSC